MDVADTIVNEAAGVPLNATAVVLARFVPTIETTVPAPPLVGVNDEIVGAGGRTVKAVALVAVPPGVVTVILPDVAAGGTVAVTVVAVIPVNDDDGVPLKSTAVAP